MWVRELKNNFVRARRSQFKRLREKVDKESRGSRGFRMSLREKDWIEEIEKKIILRNCKFDRFRIRFGD